MNARAWLCGFGIALAGVTPILGGCGNAPSAKFASVSAGPMPEGQTWVGVYYNPVYGYLHVVEESGNIVGRWRRTDSSKWGELSGTVDGNVLHYTWKEHDAGMIGPSSETHGSGVFVFKLPPPSGENAVAAELDGQYAVDESDSIGQWHCVKQVGMKPDLKSINGDNPAGAPTLQDKWQ
jgi:hypothetical protein